MDPSEHVKEKGYRHVSPVFHLVKLSNVESLFLSLRDNDHVSCFKFIIFILVSPTLLIVLKGPAGHLR